MPEFSDHLKSYLKRNHLTQSFLATTIDCSPASAGRIVRGERDITEYEFQRLLSIIPTLEEKQRFTELYNRLTEPELYECRDILKNIMKISATSTFHNITTISSTVSTAVRNFFNRISTGVVREDVYTNLPGNNCYLLYDALNIVKNKNIAKLVHLVQLEHLQTANRHKHSPYNMHVFECTLQLALLCPTYSPYYTYVDSMALNTRASFHFDYFLFDSSELLLFNHDLSTCMTLKERKNLRAYRSNFFQSFNAYVNNQLFQRSSQAAEFISSMIENYKSDIPSYFFSNSPCVSKLFDYTIDFIKIKPELIQMVPEIEQTLASYQYVSSTLQKNLRLTIFDIMTEQGLSNFVETGHFDGVLSSVFEDYNYSERAQMLKNMLKYLRKQQNQFKMIKRDSDIGEAFIIELYKKTKCIKMYFFTKDNNLFSLTIQEENLYASFEDFLANIDSIYPIYTPAETLQILRGYIENLDKKQS